MFIWNLRCLGPDLNKWAFRLWGLIELINLVGVALLLGEE
ncbi:hypothetical protein KT71_002862 [Congregibacter litoralis KT71]|uniref:Uncharacterized protein n=1 Tax=Congregibacter litoralis KT71 TaxID=314285 RepID=V7HUU2_9GAMM|nr:hypothetical protein KT71_002862 [Congregibacter litoralis KT71]